MAPESTPPSALTAAEIIDDLTPYGQATGHTYTIGDVERSVYPIGELARALNRRPATMRKWEDLGIIPRAPIELTPGSPGGRRRLYTAEHIIGMVRIADEEGVLNPREHAIKDTQFVARVQELFAALLATA